MRTGTSRTALVAGGGGFIGGHLTRDLLARGFGRVRCVDIKPFDQWYQLHEGAENVQLDLRDPRACAEAIDGVDEVFNLACDMGGMGFIENNKAACMVSVLINTHLLVAARAQGVSRYFYASSACVYNGTKQTRPDDCSLREEDAYPALPEDGYGWEKLFSERLCRHFREDYGMHTRVARFHNVYGPEGTWDGGREKAPAAICRKVIQAKLTGEASLEVWGDGEQARSFMWIDDCIEGIHRIHEGPFVDPINLGSSELVTINELVSIVEDIADVQLERRYLLDAPRGVRGRNSDNTLIQREFGWEPSTPLQQGMEQTFRWIYDQILSATPSPLPQGEATSTTEADSPWHGSSSSTSTTGPTSQARAST